MTTCRRAVIAAITFSSLAAASAHASARTVRHDNVVSPSGQISCYAVLDSTRIECMAPYLPDVGEFDTLLGLRSRGRAILAERSDFPGSSAPRRALRYGDVWRRPGIRCTMRTSGLTCRNRDRHGFHIERGHVRRF